MIKMIDGFPSTFGDDYQLNTNEFIRYAATTFPEVEVISRNLDGTLMRYNYEQAYARVGKLANALKKLGVKPGDRVGVMEWNTHRFFELYLAISGIGAVLLQINPRISNEDRAYVVNHAGATVICVSESMISLIESIQEKLDEVREYIILHDEKRNAIKTKLAPVHDYETLLEPESSDYDWPMINECSAYSGAYTSGTTGKPKAVYYSHRTICLHTLCLSTLCSINSSDVLMQIVPMFHCHGWGVFFCAALTGAKLIFSGKYSAEKTQPLVDLLISEKVTMTCGAPAIFMPMLHYIKTLKDKPHFNNLRMLSGATAPPVSVMKDYAEMGADIIHAYGATETTPIVSLNFLKPSLAHLPEEEKWALRLKQGCPVPFVSWKLLDANGKEVPRDGESVGEGHYRGPWITASYYNDERSKDAFTEDGYWKSGDALTMDKYGYLKVTDRFKDVIKSGGEWISSIDLENAIMAHPNVVEASVAGIPHPKWEERPLALVVLDKTAGEVTEDDILNFIMPKFAKWQLPDRILFVDEIPKTSVGKFSKKDIRKEYGNFYSQQ